LQIFKNNIPSSESDVGAKGYGIVVFEVVTTIPYPPAGGRWNIVTIFNFETSTTGCGKMIKIIMWFLITNQIFIFTKIYFCETNPAISKSLEILCRRLPQHAFMGASGLGCGYF